MSEMSYKVVDGRLQVGNLNDVLQQETFSKFLRRKQSMGFLLRDKPKERAKDLKKHNYTFKNKHEHNTDTRNC